MTQLHVSVPADVRSWVRQICEAMKVRHSNIFMAYRVTLKGPKYIHSNRIVHRDLKAEVAHLQVKLVRALRAESRSRMPCCMTEESR